MGMNILGGAGAYARTKMLRVQWDQKRGTITDPSGAADEQAGVSPCEAARKERLQSIRDKMDAGEPLTRSEREFLKANDPQAYADLEAEEAEQRAYEEELKRCRTKQDVQRLRTRWLGASMSRAQAALRGLRPKRRPGAKEGDLCPGEAAHGPGGNLDKGVCEERGLRAFAG